MCIVTTQGNCCSFHPAAGLCSFLRDSLGAHTMEQTPPTSHAANWPALRICHWCVTEADQLWSAVCALHSPTLCHTGWSSQVLLTLPPSLSLCVWSSLPPFFHSFVTTPNPGAQKYLTCTYKRTIPFQHTHTCAHTCAHTPHTHLYIYMHTDIDTDKPHTHTHTHIHTLTSTHSHIHTQQKSTHTDTHRHTHT